MSEPLSGRIVEPGDAPGSGSGPRRIGLLSPKWARAWIVPVVFGAASIVLGVLVLFWPGHTVGALTALFGLYLMITGLYRFFAAIQLHGVDPVARMVALVKKYDGSISAEHGIGLLKKDYLGYSRAPAELASASDSGRRGRRTGARVFPGAPGLRCSGWPRGVLPGA